MRRIILLTEPAFAEKLALPLWRAAKDLKLDAAHTLDDLSAALDAGVANTRLLAFGSGVIVPARQLARLPGPAYNFHAGPPAYPGLFPSVFALYEGARTFGATLHEMTADIDGGPIVAVRSFPIPDDADRMVLDILTFKAMLEMLDTLAPQLVDVTTPLPRSGEAWSGPKRTKDDFESLCQLPEGVDENEFSRRYRAVGEGPHHALRIKMFGHSFKLDNRREGEAVVRAGQMERIRR